MKNRQTNGAVAIRPAKTSDPLLKMLSLKRLACCERDFIKKCNDTHLHGGGLEARFDKAGIGWDDLPPKVQIMVAEERADRATVKLEVEIPLWVYKELCAGAVVHGLADWKEMLVEYLRCTVTEWASEQGYYIDP